MIAVNSIYFRPSQERTAFSCSPNYRFDVARQKRTMIDWLAESLTDWLTDRMSDWLIDLFMSLIDWLIDWCHWLID